MPGVRTPVGVNQGSRGRRSQIPRPRFRGEPPHNCGRSPDETSRGCAYVFARRSRGPRRRSVWGSKHSVAHARQRYAIRMPVLSARIRPRPRRSALRHCGQRRARVSVGPELECATSSTRSLLFSLIDPSVLVAPVTAGILSRSQPGRRLGRRGAWRGVVTMTVGQGVEQGGPGAVIPAREADNLIAHAASSPLSIPTEAYCVPARCPR
jgi:hypothetical protein